MSYELLILRRAQKDLAKLPKADFERMRAALTDLAIEPRPVGCKKLVGREGWRIRSGNYRAIYEVDDTKKCVTILHIGNRSDIYS